MESIEEQFARLDAMGAKELREEFLKLYGFSSGKQNREALLRRLKYRCQELAFGGLTDEELAEIDRLVPKEFVKRQEALEKLSVPGTRLSRRFKGRDYEVTILGDGRFEYAGRVYQSLTAVAERITGTHWNGKRFFGLTI